MHRTEVRLPRDALRNIFRLSATVQHVTMPAAGGGVGGGAARSATSRAPEEHFARMSLGRSGLDADAPP